MTACCCKQRDCAGVYGSGRQEAGPATVTTAAAFAERLSEPV